MSRKKKRKGSGFFSNLLLLLCVVVFCVAAWKLWGYYNNYHGGRKEYEQLRQYVKEKKDSDKAYHLLHSWVIDEDVLSSLSLGDDTAMITVVSPEFIDEPGIISNITNPLRKNDINIVEISSSQTAVVLFVDWKDGEKALELIKEVLK